MWFQSTIGVLGLSLVIGCSAPVAEAQQERDKYARFERFARVLQEIQEKYVDEVEADRLWDGAIKGMLSELDPYSEFITPEKLAQLKVDTEGQFGGIGIEISIKEGILTVLTPIVGTPAFRAGLMAGDRILRVDGKTTEGITLKEAVGKLRGKPGESVTLTVLRQGAQAAEEITIAREVIQVASVRSAKMVDDDARIGYVHLTCFMEKTAEELDKGVRRLEQEGMRALILDLRFNPGGRMSAALDVAGRFIAQGVIATTKGRKPAQGDTYKASGKDTYSDFPLAVLINSGSAGASEIVAAAIRDHKRGVLVGEKSFGKGAVQSVIQLEGGKSALKLTTAKYFTPSGESFHGKGIQPDIEVKLTPHQAKSITDHMTRERVREAAKDAKADAAAEPSPDIQLDAALVLLRQQVKR
ncbi:MAG: S41 family peptidase [Planctomycetes bacterium]|nr:S41 family peptidase [Planctomycetota bacterium]